MLSKVAIIEDNISINPFMDFDKYYSYFVSPEKRQFMHIELDIHEFSRVECDKVPIVITRIGYKKRGKSIEPITTRDYYEKNLCELGKIMPEELGVNFNRFDSVQLLFSAMKESEPFLYINLHQSQ
jgi:hypothetical protein